MFFSIVVADKEVALGLKIAVRRSGDPELDTLSKDQSNIDGLVKSRKCILSVIPAKTGIQCSQALKNSWTPFFNGVTTFYEIINIGSPENH
jgi:hypothetical protein